MASEQQSFLRVYYVDDAWTTIPAKLETTASQICDTISKKRNLSKEEAEEHGLYIFDFNNENSFERRLDATESPLEIQEVVRKHGQLDTFKFVFKSSKQKDSEKNDDDNSSDSDEEGMFSKAKVPKADDCQRMGYMDKRGKRNTAWKERWFVLQGDKLFYFKSHEHANAISYIPITDAVIRESVSPTRNSGSREYLFEVNTKQRVFYLRARTQGDMVLWIRELRKHTSLEAENEIIDEIQQQIDENELAKANAEEKEMERISKLLGVLRNGNALDYFLQFLTQNHTEENLLFWVDAEDYRTTKRSLEEMKKKGMQIYDKFVKVGAEMEIAVTKDGRIACKECIENGDPNAFVQLQSKTFALLETGSFPGFFASPLFQKALLKMPISSRTTDVWKDNQYRLSLNNAQPPPDEEEEKKEKEYRASLDFLDTSPLDDELFAQQLNAIEDEHNNLNNVNNLNMNNNNTNISEINDNSSQVGSLYFKNSFSVADENNFLMSPSNASYTSPLSPLQSPMSPSSPHVHFNTNTVSRTRSVNYGHSSNSTNRSQHSPSPTSHHSSISPKNGKQLPPKKKSIVASASPQSSSSNTTSRSNVTNSSRWTKTNIFDETSEVDEKIGSSSYIPSSMSVSPSHLSFNANIPSSYPSSLLSSHPSSLSSSLASPPQTAFSRSPQTTSPQTFSRSQTTQRT